MEMKQDPLAAIHQCIQSHREKIGAILMKDGNGKLFDTLCEALSILILDQGAGCFNFT